MRARTLVLALAPILLSAPALAQPELQPPPGPIEWPLILPELIQPDPYPQVRVPIRIDWNPELLAEHQRALELQRRLEELTEIHAAEQAFTPIESGGLIGQITSISASISVSLRQWGRPGVSAQRNLNINGAITDLSGIRAFRIVGTPRIVEMTDQDGRDLLPSITWSAYPDAGNLQPFTRPVDSGSGMLQQSFAFSTAELLELPPRIGTMRIDVDAAIAGESSEVLLRAEVTKEFQELAPGVAARVATSRQEGGQTLLSIEYRLSDLPDGGTRRLFMDAEALDDEQRLLQAQSSTQEAQTSHATFGAVTFWNIETTDSPVWYVRLRLVTISEVVHLQIVEHDLPMLGG